MQCAHKCDECGYIWDCAFPNYEKYDIDEALARGFSCISDCPVCYPEAWEPKEKFEFPRKYVEGSVYVFDPKIYRKKIMRIKARLKIDWDMYYEHYRFFPKAHGECPLCGSKVKLNLIFNDDYSMRCGYEAGECIHFFPEKHLGRENLQKMDKKQYRVEANLYLPESKEEFARSMGWELYWFKNAADKWDFLFVKRHNLFD